MATGDLSREDNPSYHIAILHQKLQQEHEDRYLTDIAVALINSRHKIVFYVSSLENPKFLNFIKVNTEKIRLKYSAWWIPNHICGGFKRAMIHFKTFWMAFCFILFPPKPKPKIIILDTESFILVLFSWFTKYKTIYIKHFPEVYASDHYPPRIKIIPNLLTAKSLGYADEIVVQSRGLAGILRRSFPKINRDPQVLHPCYDMGAWKSDVIDVKRIIPDLPNEYYLFVAFGEYKKRTNFKLLLDSLECLHAIRDSVDKHKFHVVIAGNLNENSLEEREVYEKLIKEAKDNPFGHQVTFLKEIPSVQKKTLLSACTALIHVTNYDVYPGLILAALKFGKIVISINQNFFDNTLQNRLTGIYTKPRPDWIARIMDKIVENRNLKKFIGSMAKYSYTSRFSGEAFENQINELVLKLGGQVS